MTDFLTTQEFVAYDVRFCLPEASFKGTGFLRWDPATGFSLDVVILNRRDRKRLERIVVPSGPSFRAITDVRTTLGKSYWVITPVYDLREDLNLWSGRPISTRSPTALFRREYDRAPADVARWHGGATIRVLSRTLLPDRIVEEVTLNGKRTRQAFRLGGLDIEGDDGWLRAELQKPDVLRASWALDRNAWPKGSDWRFAEALATALGILTGQRPWVLQRTSIRERREYTEVRWVSGTARDLDLLAPWARRDFLNKQHLYALVRLLARGGTDALLCRRIFSQLTDASMQGTWYARELLTATILEAIMRSVFHRPFVQGDKSWDFRLPLRDYCRTRLGEDWLDVADRVFKTHKRLRHRNAHPDWTLEIDGSASRPQMEEAIDDLIFLSRFYGYVMLSLAGVGELDPKFPPPHREWPPLGVISFGEEASQR